MAVVYRYNFLLLPLSLALTHPLSTLLTLLIGQWWFSCAKLFNQLVVCCCAWRCQITRYVNTRRIIALAIILLLLLLLVLNAYQPPTYPCTTLMLMVMMVIISVDMNDDTTEQETANEAVAQVIRVICSRPCIHSTYYIRVYVHI